MRTTKSIEELVKAFESNGGRVEVIPEGTAGEVKYLGFFKRARAYSRKRREIWQAHTDAIAHGREKHNVSTYAPVDVFMKQGMD